MSICVFPFRHAIPSSVSLPLVVGMMGATKNIEQHPEERDHPHKEPTLNNPQCHGSRLPCSMDLPGVFMNTWQTVRSSQMLILSRSAFSTDCTYTYAAPFNCWDEDPCGAFPSHGSDEGFRLAGFWRSNRCP